MVCVHSPSLVIGGTTHENISNLAVVQDAMGASMASISTKFLVSGLLSFSSILDKVANKYINDNFDINNVGYKYQVVMVMCKCIAYVIDTVYEVKDTNIKLTHKFCSQFLALCTSHNKCYVLINITIE